MLSPGEQRVGKAAAVRCAYNAATLIGHPMPPRAAGSYSVYLKALHCLNSLPAGVCVQLAYITAPVCIYEHTLPRGSPFTVIANHVFPWISAHAYKFCLNVY